MPQRARIARIAVSIWPGRAAWSRKQEEDHMVVNTLMKAASPWRIGVCCLLIPWLAFADTPAACDPQIVGTADPGYTCVVKTRTGPVSWRVEAVSQGSRPARVVKDLRS